LLWEEGQDVTIEPSEPERKQVYISLGKWRRRDGG